MFRGRQGPLSLISCCRGRVVLSPTAFFRKGTRENGFGVVECREFWAIVERLNGEGRVCESGLRESSATATMYGSTHATYIAQKDQRECIPPKETTKTMVEADKGPRKQVFVKRRGETRT